MDYFTMSLNGVGYVLKGISTILNLASPFLFAVATCIWIMLYWRVRSELDRAYLRTYALEQQMDFLVNRSDVDMEYYHFMKKTYKDLEDKKHG